MDTDDLLALSVLGPRGIVDLVVPGGASAEDVAAEYARHAGLSSRPTLHSGLGMPIPAGAPLASTDVTAGDVLIAVTDVRPEPSDVPGGPRPVRRLPAATPPGKGAGLWTGVAAGLAALAGGYAARLTVASEQTLAVNVLLVAAVVGVVPFGRYAGPRSAAAPVFAAAAAYASAWQPDPDSLPFTWGVVGLAAAVTAAASRALMPDQVNADQTVSRRDEAHLVWIVAGVLLFLVASLAAFLHLSAPGVWSLLLVAAMLGARLVPTYAIGVPDQLLVDFERLAVSAWSAREQPVGRRGRMVIARSMVARVVERGQRIISAAGVAIALVAASSAYLLLGSEQARLDQLGASLLVFFVGGSLLFAAGSYRNAAARMLLRGGGLACWVLLAWARVPQWSTTTRSWLVLGAVVLGLLCIVSAVATGRGWRSVWWARRAEVGEAVCGTFAIAALSVSSGLFRMLWELTSR